MGSDLYTKTTVKRVEGRLKGVKQKAGNTVGER